MINNNLIIKKRKGEKNKYGGNKQKTFCVMLETFKNRIMRTGIKHTHVKRRIKK
jgi:hypothetical protein